MRKVMWTCVAVMLASSAWLYMAALYVAHRPNSKLTRCAVAAYRVSTDYNPIYRVSHACAGRVRRAVLGLLSQPAYRSEAVTASACGAAAARNTCAGTAKSIEEYQIKLTPPATEDALQRPYIKEFPTEISQESHLEFTTPDVTYEGVTEESAAPPTSTAPADGDVPEKNLQKLGIFENNEEAARPTVTAIDPDDDDAAPPTMPIVPEDEAKPEEPPATMPYLEDDDEDKAMFELWKSLLIQDSDTAAKKTEDAGQEESESAAEEESNDGQMPASHYSSHPSHPGCERTVVCPYTGKSYPVDPRDDAPAPTTRPKKKKKKDANGEGASAAPPDGGTISRVIEEEKGTEDTPVHTEVDTTEYRPSDARKGEFDPMPE